MITKSITLFNQLKRVIIIFMVKILSIIETISKKEGLGLFFSFDFQYNVCIKRNSHGTCHGYPSN